MRPSLRVRVALAFVAGMAAVPIAFWAMRARAQDATRPEAQALQDPRLAALLALSTTAFGGFGGGARDDQPAPPPSVVHVVAPITARAARTWEKLHTTAEMRFPKEVPFEDFLDAVRKATKGPNDKGVQIYVEPVGLNEAQKTMSSPVTVDVEDVPVSTVLALVLKQLALKYYVQQDGIVMITAESDEDHVTDPSAKLLDEVSTLRVELATLRRELGLLRDAPKRASPQPATGAGVR